MVPDTFASVALVPATSDEQWQERALCAQTDPEAFFPEKGGSTREAK
ncbi:MAG: WhiB family transcriptional regulator, partial [Mycolicibacterium sp.]|nr:WhiB family transcriptional regulator [Mycolicibacterium sp.]